MNQHSTILVAPLNWGLGHATRCVPIIEQLLENNFGVVIAGDGPSLTLLRHEFPDLPSVVLPSYTIAYHKSGKRLKRKLLFATPKILRSIYAEHKALQGLIQTHNITGVISDNRWGLYTSSVPTVFITHQLKVLSGRTTGISTWIQQYFIKKFDRCWVPDASGAQALSGILSSLEKPDNRVDYIGTLSRFTPVDLPQKWKAMIVLSGPEPQRSILENHLKIAFKKFNGNVLLVRGVVEQEQRKQVEKNITIYNFLTTLQLNTAICESAFVVARSGYTTIMDLAVLGKKAYFIPTPGQPEQEYLASYLKQKRIAPFSEQEDFQIKDLARLALYTGFTTPRIKRDLFEFFGLFEGKREFRTHSKLTFDINSFVMRFDDMLDYRKSKP